MEVRIEELETSIDAVDGQALLTPDVLARIVAAVCHELDARDRRRAVRGAERDLRSLVDRQRQPLDQRVPGVNDG